MASFTSLGIHAPTALELLIAESALPPNPSPNEYVWSSYDDGDDELGGEEVISTPKCVIWSQGGIARRIFKFNDEHQTVVQALLTRFTTSAEDGEISNEDSVLRFEAVTPQKSGRGNATGKIPDHTRQGVLKAFKARALVILLPRQARIYFRDGSSFIVSLPFEVERAFTAPEGLLLQRKLARLELPSSVPPIVPPNHFRTSQHETSNLRASTLRAGARRSSGRNNTPSAYKDTSDERHGSHDETPRLFTLTDPLAPIGLVVSGATALSSRGAPELVEMAEDLLYVSRINEAPTTSVYESPILVVSANRRRRTFTIWQLSYVNTKSMFDHQHNHISKTLLSRSRRRSSISNFAGTATSTPNPKYTDGFGPSFSASFSGATPVPASLTKPRRTSDAQNRVTGVDALLEEEMLQKTNLPGRVTEGNRRTSSILARAELVNVDNGNLSDLTINTAGAVNHFGSSFHKRRSFGPGDKNTQRRYRHSFRASTPGSISDISDGDITMQHDGPNDLWDDLTADNGYESLSSLHKRAVLSKITSVPMELSTAANLQDANSMHDRLKVIILSSTPKRSDPVDAYQRLNVFIHDRGIQTMLNTSLIACAPKRRKSLGESEPDLVQYAELRPLSNGFNWDRTLDITDVEKVRDGAVSRMVVLHEFGTTSQLSLIDDWITLRQKHAGRVSFAKIGRSKPFAIPLTSSEKDPSSAPLGGSMQRPDNVSWNTRLPEKAVRISHIGQCGQLNVVDRSGIEYRYQIQLQPRVKLVSTTLDALRLLVSHAHSDGPNVLAIWWSICSTTPSITEWHALVVVIFILVLAQTGENLQEAKTSRWKSAARSTDQHGSRTPGSPRFDDGTVWKAIAERLRGQPNHDAKDGPVNAGRSNEFILRCVDMARDSQDLHSKAFRAAAERSRYLTTLFTILYVLRQEVKLDALSLGSRGAGNPSLGPVLAQISIWLGWMSSPTSVTSVFVHEMSTPNAFDGGKLESPSR